MFTRLLLLFILVPAIELSLLIEVGKVIGFWSTMGLIVLTGFIGSSLTRQQGLSVWTRFNGRMQQGQLPGTELVDGLIILVAGALLLTPGILTDVVGFLGLIPQSRKLIRSAVQKRIKVSQGTGGFQFQSFSFGQPPPSESPSPNQSPQWQGTPLNKPASE